MRFDIPPVSLFASFYLFLHLILSGKVLRFSQLPRSNIYACGLRIRNDIVSRNIPFRLVAYIYLQ